MKDTTSGAHAIMIVKRVSKTNLLASCANSSSSSSSSAAAFITTFEGAADTPFEEGAAGTAVEGAAGTAGRDELYVLPPSPFGLELGTSVN